MTPKRKAYLAKCSEREILLRKIVQQYKNCILPLHKYALNKDETFTEEDRRYRLTMIRYAKYHLSIYRRELARLKGMDRVVVPVVTDKVQILDMIFFKTWCVCGEPLSRDYHNYCPKCGKKVMWEKVK